MATKEAYSKRAKVRPVYKNERGEKVPGVTTILGAVLSKPALIHWSWKLGIQGIDYRVHRDELADIGTLTHNMILCHLQGKQYDTSEYTKSMIGRSENAFLSYLEWERQHKIEPELIETSMVSKSLDFGGKPDYYGLIDGIATVMDFKTGKAIYDDYFYQIAAYGFMIKEMGHPVDQYRVLNIGRDENEMFVEELRADVDLELSIFFDSLKIYQAKKAIKKRGKDNQ